MAKKTKTEKTEKKASTRFVVPEDLVGAVGKAVHALTTNYKRNPRGWSPDKLPYTDEFEGIVEKALEDAGKNTPKNLVMACRATYLKFQQARKAGKLSEAATHHSNGRGEAKAKPKPAAKPKAKKAKGGVIKARKPKAAKAEAPKPADTEATAQTPTNG